MSKGLSFPFSIYQNISEKISLMANNALKGIPKARKGWISQNATATKQVKTSKN